MVAACAPALAQKNDDWAKMSDSKSSSSSDRQFKYKEKIEATYDKFKDVTTLSLEYMEVREGVGLGAAAFAKGRGYPSTSTPVVLMFSIWSEWNEQWHCLHGCEVVFLVNEQRMRLGVAKNGDPQIGRGGVIEVIGVTLPYETFRRIAFADSVEFQVGTDEATLKQNHLAALPTLPAAYSSDYPCKTKRILEEQFRR
jgi:hypothetical protein